MTGLDLLLAIAGTAVTVMVVVGMILITPRGQVKVDSEADNTSGARELDGRRTGPESARRAADQETSA